jgi:DNA end-binding protein Ku
MANYKSAISFGLVNIPVTLNPIIQDNDTSFNMLHKKCMERIKYIKYCPHCDTEVRHEDLVKGYEYSEEDYVVFDEKDFDKIKSDEDKTIEIISFIDLKDIDPIYYEKSYYLKTHDKSKAFSLFKYALKKQNKVALAKTVLGNKSYYVVIRFGADNIIMTTLFYQEEIRLDEETKDEDFTKKELELALKLIDSMSGKFKPETYKDEYQDKIKDAINKKINGQEIKKTKKKKKENITDLMEALEKSLKRKEK